MQRKKTFLVVWISIATATASAQSKAPVFGDKIIFAPRFEGFIKPRAPAAALSLPAPILPLPAILPFLATPPPPMAPSPFPINAVDGGYYSTHLGLFCKEELSIQKATRLPVFFRLGSLDYVNKLEGK